MRIDQGFATASFCPVCCLEIPAFVKERRGFVVMEKDCLEHGHFEAILERDPLLYALLRTGTAGIYPGHFIDVTERCSLNCAYCYFPVNRDARDPAMAAIIREAAFVGRQLYLAGGEPTMRKDLLELIERLVPYGGAGMPTNGIGLLDKAYLLELMKHVGRGGEGGDHDYARIALSWHAGQNEKVFWQVIDNLRAIGERIAGPIFVLRTLAELPDLLAVVNKCRDVIAGARIHIETAVWQCRSTEQIFMSDLLRAVNEHAKADRREFAWSTTEGRTMWLPTRYDGLPLYLIRWNTIHDCDLPNMELEPTYRAHNGSIVHMITGYIINEAMQRGWLMGSKIPPFVKL